jgi:glyoxylase-like metal-dependent hydrolase (beta-lactamase superfamily II)
MTRRSFVGHVVRGTTALVVLGVAACRADTGDGGDGDARWRRVDLGFVSAVVIARAGELAVIDTGVAGSEDAIGEVVAELGSGWSDVGTVIVTHRHNDHQGSLPAVLGRAPDAAAYAGHLDVPAIDGPRSVIGVGDGDSVFGLDVIDTPGHTPGHISLLDPVLSLLVSGDAMNGTDGGVTGANPQFTDDMDRADESVRKLAGFDFDDVVFGHGSPLLGDASLHVRELADSL